MNKFLISVFNTRRYELYLMSSNWISSNKSLLSQHGEVIW